MPRPKKQVEDESLDEEELVSESTGGDDSASPGTNVSLPDDDLIGEPESREPEQADSLGLEENAEGGVDPNAGEDKSQPLKPLPDEFIMMDKAPRVGVRIMVFTPAGEYLRVFCKRSRRFIDRRWQMSEKWCDAVTGKDIEFEPLGWRSLKAGE